MAGGQDVAGRRRAGIELKRICIIRVHDCGQASTALDTAKTLDIKLTLVADSGAATFGGVGFLRALGDLSGHELVVDCADRAGLALAALREGLKDIVFCGSPTARTSLCDIASQTGAQVRELRPQADIDLDPGDDAGFAIKHWYDCR